jgi:hypothetical protein
MDRDDFIITVYCLVCEHYQTFEQRYCQQRTLRGGGFTPGLTDAEVITIEICGEYFKLHQDQDLFDYFSSHYRHFFPRLRERTRFVRQAAALWQVKAFIQRQLVHLSGADQDPVQAIDTLPLPVCGYTRSGRDRCFMGEADYGYCAAKEMRYYGFKLGLRIARCGMITHYPLLAARPHDVKHLPTLVEGYTGLVPGDKGFIDPFGQAWLESQQGAIVITPQRRNMRGAAPHPPVLRRACSKWRKKIETVGSQLTERFAVARLRVHDLWHYQHRLIRKVLAHTVAVFLNLQLGRPPLDLDDLVTV